jgi:hypothetical protein
MRVSISWTVVTAHSQGFRGIDKRQTVDADPQIASEAEFYHHVSSYIKEQCCEASLVFG